MNDDAKDLKSPVMKRKLVSMKVSQEKLASMKVSQEEVLRVES